MTSEVFNIDCLEYMRTLPDKAFQLAIADPSYGININESIGRRKGDQLHHEETRFSDVIEIAREYVKSIGGFEKLAEWGLIRP